MRVPPYYHIPFWQRFLAGIVFGIIISWILFLSLYGEMQDNHVQLLKEQLAEIESLESRIALYQEDIEEINQQNENKLLIQDIQLEIMNAEKMKLIEIERYELEKQAKQQLEDLILNKNIETVAQNKELLISSLENKQFKIDEKTYRLSVKQLYLYTTLEMYVDVSLPE